MRLPVPIMLNAFVSLSRRSLGLVLLIVISGLISSPRSLAARTAWQADVIALSPNGRFVAASFMSTAEVNPYRIKDGGIWLYDLENMFSPALHLMESRFSHIDMVFSPDNNYLAIVDVVGLYVHRTADGSRIFDLLRPSSPRTVQNTIEFSPDSAYLRAFNIWHRSDDPDRYYDLIMPIWDFKNSRLAITAVTNPIDSFTKLWLNPAWNQLVAYEHVYEFDIAVGTGGSIGMLEEPGYSGFGDGQGELFHPDKPLFATTTYDCILQIYDTRSWTVVKRWAHPDSECEYGISEIDFSRAIPWLAFTDHPKYWQWCESQEQARLVVWDYEKDVLVFESATYASHARFTPDDRFIIASGCRAGNGDAQISVWDTENGFDFVAYPGISPQLHPDSETMITIGYDGNIWIWNLAKRAPVAILPALPA